MLHKVGLLPSHNHQQIPFAYRMYQRTDQLGWKQSTAFKKAFSIDVDIEFIGVWSVMSGVVAHSSRPLTLACRTGTPYVRSGSSRSVCRSRHRARPFAPSVTPCRSTSGAPSLRRTTTTDRTSGSAGWEHTREICPSPGCAVRAPIASLARSRLTSRCHRRGSSDS